jgi:hypothetical protein
MRRTLERSILTFLCLGFAQVALAKPHIMMTTSARNMATPLEAFMHPNATTLTHELDYYGGGVLSNVRVIGVFWGSSVDSTVRSQMGDFYTTFTNSPMMDFMTEYNTTSATKAINGHGGTNQVINRGTYGGDFVITPAHTATTVDDTDVQAEIAAQIAAGNLPAADGNTLYMVHFPPNVTITMQGSSSCQSFCAYHGSYLDKGGKDVFYGVMPDFTSGACSVASGGGCGSATDFQNFTSAASHEVSEAITDSQIADVTGSSIDYPAAWYSVNDNMEIGDICAYTSSGTLTSTKTQTSFTIQGEWSNAKNECYTGSN